MFFSWLVYDDIRMLLGMIPMFCFGILGVILEKNRKSAKTGKSRHYRAPTSQCREPMPRRRPRLRCGIPSLQQGLGAQNGTP